MQALIADDETTTRLMLSRMMTKWGYEVVEADNGLTALEALQSDTGPYIAVLDWMMPGLDGIDICEKLRSDPKSRYVYTILITHRDQEDDLSLALRVGADDFVRKPVNPAELRSRLMVGARVATYDQRLRRYANDMEQLAESRAKQLAHADRMSTLGLLSAGVAHEINNPATFISGNLQTLRRFWKDLEPMVQATMPTENAGRDKLEFISAETPRVLNGIRDGVERITKIVKSLKSYARQERGSKRQCDVKQCIDNAIEISRFQVKKRGLKIERSLPDVPLPVFADAQQLEQVFVNLMVNASDAMEGCASPSLRIDASADAGLIKIGVEDRGPGIPAEILERIWQPFFTTKEAGKGTGLGLAICRDIIEEHEGRLLVDRSDKEGTRFVIELPTPQLSVG